jgi:hypothetical protein
MIRRKLDVKKIKLCMERVSLQDELSCDQLPNNISAVVILTIYVLVVYAARDVMILMWTNPISRAKSRFSGPTPSSGRSNRFPPIKIIKSKRRIKKQVTLVILCT